jgi:hypothetical protein
VRLTQKGHVLDAKVRLNGDSPDLSQSLTDFEIWRGCSPELRELAKTIVDPNLRLAWVAIVSRLIKHEQGLVDSNKLRIKHKSDHY